MAEYKKYGPTTQARENLAYALAEKDESTYWHEWADSDTGKGHWRHKADKLVQLLRQNGYEVVDCSGPVS